MSAATCRSVQARNCRPLASLLVPARPRDIEKPTVSKTKHDLSRCRVGLGREKLSGRQVPKGELPQSLAYIKICSLDPEGPTTWINCDLEDSSCQGDREITPKLGLFCSETRSGSATGGGALVLPVAVRVRCLTAGHGGLSRFNELWSEPRACAGMHQGAGHSEMVHSRRARRGGAWCSNTGPGGDDGLSTRVTAEQLLQGWDRLEAPP